jgi:hypothetical protein
MTEDAADDFDDEGSIAALACMVRDLCADAEDRLPKADFVALAGATASILLAASGADEVMMDVSDDEDGFVAEHAAVIREIWKRRHK